MALCWFFFSSRRRHTRLVSDWSSDVFSSDLRIAPGVPRKPVGARFRDPATLPCRPMRSVSDADADQASPWPYASGSLTGAFLMRHSCVSVGRTRRPASNSTAQMRGAAPGAHGLVVGESTFNHALHQGGPARFRGSVDGDE